VAFSTKNDSWRETIQNRGLTRLDAHWERSGESHARAQREPVNSKNDTPEISSMQFRGTTLPYQT
jgi:hypothetical protein